MKNTFLFITAILCFQVAVAQKIFNTDKHFLTVKVNEEVLSREWKIDTVGKSNFLEVECKQAVNTVLFSDGKDSIRFILKEGEQFSFNILHNHTDTVVVEVTGATPNLRFSASYIEQHNGKTIVEIPEVYELVNVIMALHTDAEKESNMFDTKTAYYRRVKEYFSSYASHPAVDTIQKYISGLTLNEEHNMSFFSREGYAYYFALKMNACNYEFDANNRIKNKGFIKEMAKGWYMWDPMKHVDVFEDFAQQTHFRQFYQDNKPYYDSLVDIYNQLNPIQQMQSWLDKKFGFGYGSYMVYFSPLVYGAHSTQRFDEGNFSQTFMFICRAEMSEEYSPIMNELLESRVVFTEIDHNYVNPVSDKMLNKINVSFSNREKWAAGDIAATYRNPYMVFNEYMTFAVYSLYLYDHYSEEDIHAFLPKMEKQMEESRGFIRFKDFNRALLHKYMEQPSLSIEELYHYILDWSVVINDL